jgi:hypothetical protein
MSSSFPVHTVEDIIAAFGLKDNKITPIEGTPTLQTLLRAHNELRNASIKIRHCAKGNFGYLYLTELPVVYATWQPNIPYVPPINPGDTPNLTNLFGNAMEQAKIEWARNRQVYEMHKNVNTALISVFRKAIDSDIIVDIETDPAIHGVEDFLTYFDQFMRGYGHTDPLAVEKITKAMEEPWNPTTDDISKLIRQMRDAMRYMTYINQPISENELLNKAELLILKSQQMKNEYSLWKSLAHHDRTWHNFCVWWKEKYHIWKTVHTSASMLGYGGGIQSSDEYEIDINNAATNAANAATFQQLTQSNNALAQQLQALAMQNSQLQQQIANVQQAPAFQQPPIMYQPLPPQMPQQQFVPQQQFIAPQVQQQQYGHQQYGQQQYAHQDYSGRGRGAGGRGYGRGYGRGSGRGTGRGYGRGGGRGLSRGNSGYQNQQQQYNNGQGGDFYSNVNRDMNPVKRHDNMWYCWSHGFDVDHHSGNCENPKLNHQYNATRNNTMGGCQAKKHKTILPSQSGAGGNGMYYM